MSERGVRFPYLVGTMIEVPRGALTADAIGAVAEFFSFGTNDLTQTTLGVSRDDAARFLTPYVKDFEIYRTRSVRIDRSRRRRRAHADRGRAGPAGDRKLKLGICGEHGGDPASIALCQELELDYVSCSPFRVPIARLAAAQAALQELGAGVAGPALRRPRRPGRPLALARDAQRRASRRWALPHLYLRWRVSPAELAGGAPRGAPPGRRRPQPHRAAEGAGAAPARHVDARGSRRIGAVNTLISRGRTARRRQHRRPRLRSRATRARPARNGPRRADRRRRKRARRRGEPDRRGLPRDRGREPDARHAARRWRRGCTRCGAPERRSRVAGGAAHGMPLEGARLVVNTTPVGLAGRSLALRIGADAAPLPLRGPGLRRGPVTLPACGGARRASHARRRRHAAPPGRARLRSLDGPTARRSPRWRWRSVLRASPCPGGPEPVASGAPPARTMTSRLGDLLRRRGALAAEQLASAIEAQREHGGALAGISSGSVCWTRTGWSRCSAAEYRAAGRRSAQRPTSPATPLEAVPHALARRHELVPVALDGAHADASRWPTPPIRRR